MFSREPHPDLLCIRAAGDCQARLTFLWVLGFQTPSPYFCSKFIPRDIAPATSYTFAPQFVEKFSGPPLAVPLGTLRSYFVEGTEEEVYFVPWLQTITMGEARPCGSVYGVRMFIQELTRRQQETGTRGCLTFKGRGGEIQMSQQSACPASMRP